MNIQYKIIPTSYWATIFVAGNPVRAEEEIRRLTMEWSFCVTMTPTKYIYKYGLEDGVIVTLVQYPKFQDSTPENINAKAIGLAKSLMLRLYQRSCTVITPNETTYIYLGNEDARPKREEDGVSPDYGISQSRTESEGAD